MITSLRLQNFRSYKDSSFEFDPGINIVVGPNASGKTNLLEAILVLASGRSYRARDAELVRRTMSWARLDGWFDQSERAVKLERKMSLTSSHAHKNVRAFGEAQITDDGVAKSFVVDSKPFKRLSLERTLPAVLFEPNHLQLLSRGPQSRRDYMDDILERSQLGFKALSARYRRTLSQRNALLKQPIGRVKQQLFAWDIRLSQLGGQIAVARAELIGEINKGLSRSYGRIAGKRTKAEVEYLSSVDPAHYSSRLLKKLNASIELDMARGFTGYGPHREDLVFNLNRQPAAATASRGETRSLILALKIFELKLLEAKRGAKPLFLLDDVFSELDGSRRRHLVEQLKDYQTIITTTDADSVMHYFSDERLLSI